MVDRSSLKAMLSNTQNFSRQFPGLTLRNYQALPSQSIYDSINDGSADIATMVFSRQAGKDETFAQLVAILGLRYSQHPRSIVVVAPTQKPQAMISRDRLVSRLMMSPLTKRFTRARETIVTIGKVRVSFYGASKDTNARGATADLLLAANEAQDIDPDIWDAIFAPMTASTAAPSLFFGTVWSSSSLLQRQTDYAAKLETIDGRQRNFRVPWQLVGEEVPAYKSHVLERIAQLGPNHPFIRTEYELIPLDEAGKLFTGQRLRMLQGNHPRRNSPMPGERIAFMVDVAGADEDAELEPGKGRPADDTRDSTVLTVYAIEDPLPGQTHATYRTLDRYQWTNVPWSYIQSAISALILMWIPVVVVVDSTGIGFGMWTHLIHAHPRLRIEPFSFNMATKSDLGWKFLGMIESGRLQEYAEDGTPETSEFWRQMSEVTYEIKGGEAKRLSWSVPINRGHDDFVMSAALIASIDELDLRPRVARGTS